MEARIASGLTALGLTPPAGAAARLAENGRLAKKGANLLIIMEESIV